MTTRKQIADAFREARKTVESGGNTYICNALHFTACAGRHRAIRVIQKRMGPLTRSVDGYSLWHWLEERGHKPWLHGPEVMRAYRLRWLDALIEEFSA